MIARNSSDMSQECEEYFDDESKIFFRKIIIENILGTILKNVSILRLNVTFKKAFNK